MLNRREFLRNGFLAAAAVRCKPLPQPKSLREASHCSPWLIGGQTTVAEIAADPPLAERMLREFRIMTPGRELKWESVHPAPGQYRFDYADKFISWASAHGMLVRGHNLVWPDYGTPAWVMENACTRTAPGLLEEHIGAVAGRYAGRIHSWDVLNEPLNVWDKRTDLLAAHPWVDCLGPEYIDLAFHAAATADPRARLIWNQNYIESGDAGDEANRQAMLAQLRRLTKAGVPIHGIGIESHLIAGKPLAAAALERFAGEIRSLGLEIQITELDVIDTQLPLETARRDDLVADCYKQYLELMFRVADPSIVAFWTFSDRHNWLDWIAQSNSKYRRPDGAAHRPGLLDADLREKPAYQAVLSALSHHQWQESKVSVTESGRTESQ